MDRIEQSLRVALSVLRATSPGEQGEQPLATPLSLRSVPHSLGPGDTLPTSRQSSCNPANPGNPVFLQLPFATAFLVMTAACAEPPPVSISASLTGPQHAVHVTGISTTTTTKLSQLAPDDSLWSRVVAVYVDGDNPVTDTTSASPRAAHTPPVLGRYTASGTTLHFTPRFPFVPGVQYRVDVDMSALGVMAGRASETPPITHRFAIPVTARQRTTRIIAVHPALPELPSNLLRWYLEFSAPMEAGSALAHVHLIDEAGREINSAFLALDQELWDPERRRLTLLFDPGRVKRGIRTNLESGAPLVAGRRYTLVIDDRWPDGTGTPIASGYRLAFAAVAADRRSPDPTRWRLTPPRAGTRDGLRVAFGEALDHALASRMMYVVDSNGRPIAGSAQLAEGDSIWVFSPSTVWVAGSHTLRVESALEDVAGNNVDRLFDVDQRATGDRRDGAPIRNVLFQVSR